MDGTPTPRIVRSGRRAANTTLRVLGILLATLLLAVYVLFFASVDALTQDQLAYAGLIIVLGALPATVHLLSAGEAALMPLVPLHGLFYALTFGFPAFFSKTIWLVEGDAVTTALLLTISGLICLYVGYYGTRALFRGVRRVEVLDRARVDRKHLPWILYLLYLPFEVVPALQSVPSLGQLAGPLAYLGTGTLFLMALNGKVTRGVGLVVYGIIGLTLAMKVLSGSLAAGVFLLVFLSILYWHSRGRVPWGLIGLSVAIAVVLNPVKQTYREYTWNSQVPSYDYGEKAWLLAKAAGDHYAGEGVVSSVGEDRSTINRIAHIALFADVVYMTPDLVPYWDGESYKTLWTSFIPRVIMPDKPRATVGQEFGHRYGLIGEADETTSINLPWLPEFYANFGMAGVLVGMFLVGVLFRFLVQKFTAPANRPIEHVLGITLTFSLFYAESDFALMIGGVLLTYIALVVVLRLLALNGSLRRGRPTMQWGG